MFLYIACENLEERHQQLEDESTCSFVVMFLWVPQSNQLRGVNLKHPLPVWSSIFHDELHRGNIMVSLLCIIQLYMYSDAKNKDNCPLSI